MQNEQAIVCSAQQGDSGAFSMLYEENFSKVFHYMALRVSDKAEAEDMTQQVFIKAFEALPGFKWRGAPFASWLFRIAHNQVVDWQRKRSKRETGTLQDVTILSSENPEQTIETKMAVEEIIAASKSLTPAQRDVISLRFGAELSTSEVAMILGKNEGAVKALQHSAIVSLRKALKENNR
ncbi:MAG: sigma-70 family RNA polymerase sigma factor [Chloroflexi bacterium]|nr:sigma-70 family RNA polymerase sigma factor [Chloroflexota bacterium]